MSKSRRKGPTPRIARWGPWGEDPRSPLPDGDRLFGNGWWTVHVKLLDPEGWDGWLWLSIHDRPRSTRHDWREFQRIKSELVGPEREAFELYPAEARLVDTSNEYHLFVAPLGVRIPFGFTSTRTVTDNRTEFTPEQQAQLDAAREGLGVSPAQARKARQRGLDTAPTRR